MTPSNQRRMDAALVRMTLQHVTLRGCDPIKAKALAEKMVSSVASLPRFMQACNLAQVVADQLSKESDNV